MRRRKEGSALIASSVKSRRSPVFWTSQSWALTIQPKRQVWIFGNFHKRMEQHFPKFPKKRPTSRRRPKVSKKKFQGSFLSIHDQLCPQNMENSSHFENSTAFGISATFCEKFLYYLSLFPNFPNFWLNEKRPLSPHVKPVFRVRASNYDWAHCTKCTAIRPGFETFQMMNGNMHGLAEHLTFQRSAFAFAILFSRERNLLYTRINCNCGPYLSWPSLELAIKFRHKRLSCLDGLLCLV